MRHTQIRIALAMLMLASPVLAAEFTANRLFVVSRGNAQVVGFDDPGSAARTLAGNTGLSAPSGGIAFGPDGLLYVASFGTGLVHAYGRDGTLVRQIGVGSGLVFPQALVFAPNGHLLVASTGGNDLIYEFDTEGALRRILGHQAQLASPTGLAIGPAGHIFVASYGGNRILELDENGNLLRQIGTHANLVDPREIVFGADGRLYVSSQGTDRVLVFDASGVLMHELGAGSSLERPIGLAFGPDGRLYVSSSGTNEVLAFETDGGLHETYDSPDLQTPQSLAFAPYRFEVLLRGPLARDGVTTTVIKERAVVSLAPGSRGMSLALSDDPADPADLATVFRSPWLVFRGFEAADSPFARKRTMQGTQVDSNARRNGTASLLVGLTGKVLGDRSYTIKRGAGSFHRASSEAVFDAKLKTTRLLK